MAVLRRLSSLLEMIKFAHTVFALPFALLSMLWAAGGWPGWRTLGLILLAMVAARSAAMTFNRIADRSLDGKNPRTSRWPLVTGEVSLNFAWLFLMVMVLLFELAAWALNPLAFALSPLAIGILLGYSVTKRFTSLCHLLLGLALGIAPAGAWIAVRGELGLPSVLLGGAVLLWVAGFDILYSLQDREFDRKEGLHSIPVKFGVAPSLWISAIFHLGTVVLLFGAGRAAGSGWVFLGGVALAALLLAYEHAIVRPSDLSRLDAAFFGVNGWMAVLLLGAGILDNMLYR